MCLNPNCVTTKAASDLPAIDTALVSECFMTLGVQEPASALPESSHALGQAALVSSQPMGVAQDSEATVAPDVPTAASESQTVGLPSQEAVPPESATVMHPAEGTQQTETTVTPAEVCTQIHW